MANWHALTGTGDGNSYSVAYHIPIPATGNNRAGLQWRTVLINSGLGGTTILKDGDGTGGTISAAEKSSIQSGAIYEYVEAFPTNPGQTAGQLQAAVDARFTALSSSVLADIQGRLTYFGAIH